MKRLRLIIKGRVHGVFFRYTTKLLAEQLSLSGYVRNLPNDTVEVVAQGDNDKLMQIVDFCHKGPESAVVTKVEIEELPVDENLKGFKILY